MFGFLIGAIAGGAAMWVYGDQIRGYLDTKTRTARTKAADGLKTVAHTLEESASQLGARREGSGSGMGSGMGARQAGRESIG